MGFPNTDLQSMSGNFKRVYGGYEKLAPQSAMLMREIAFSSAERIGEQYVHGVELTKSHGWTMANSAATPNLNAPVSRIAKQALVDGFQSIMRSRISYIAAKRASGSDASFVTETQATVEELRVSHMERLEVLCLYGQSGLGIVGTISVPTDTVVLTEKSWADGIWVGMEGSPIDIYSSAGVFRGTKNIQSVNFDTRSLVFDTGETANLAADDVLYYQGGSATTEMAGIHKILSNTGTLFNISASDYALWRAIQIALSSGTLNLVNVLDADARCRGRGGKGDRKVLMNPSVFVDMVNDIEDARTFGGNQYKSSQIERGTESLTIYSPTGKMELVPHDCVKKGDCFGLMLSRWKRVGSTDPTFKINGGEQYFFDLQDTAALEIRSFADFAAFCTRPASNFYISNIDPTVGE